MAVVTNIQGTLIGALTTTFIFPETCTVNFQVFPGYSSLYQGQKCVTDLDERGSPLQDNYECWPSADAGIDPPQHPLRGWGYYSPGLICPTGYTQACSATYGEVPGWDNQFRLRPSETAFGCCPDGFACTNSNGNKCVAVITETTTAPTATCSGTDMANSVIATITPDDTANRVTLWAPLFQLNHQPTDLTATPRPTSSEQNEDDDDGDEGRDGGLSITAQVGIGIGITAGAAIGLACAAWLGLNRRRRRKQAQFNAALEARTMEPKSYFSVGSETTHEMYGSSRTELPQEVMPAELPSKRWTRHSERYVVSS